MITILIHVPCLCNCVKSDPLLQVIEAPSPSDPWLLLQAIFRLVLAVPLHLHHLLYLEEKEHEKNVFFSDKFSKIISGPPWIIRKLQRAFFSV